MPEVNPMAPSTADIPAVSKKTLLIAGLDVDVYGLSELSAAASAITCLWLHHPRGRRKEDMGYIANEMVSAFNASSPTTSTRGLIVVAFDQRNHGTRLRSEIRNDSWKKGNSTHAQDMFATVSGTVMDTIHLLDLLQAHLFSGPEHKGEQRHIDSNLVLGVSLGGHCAWQLLFSEPRITAGVVVVGCPDYMNMMQDRARRSKLETVTAADNGFSFFGSHDFPKSLIAACEKFDPKAILFGTREIPTELSSSDEERLRTVLDSKIRGKRFQVLSGGADRLVPYDAGRQFMDFFQKATDGWYKDGNVYMENNIYPEVGHTFSEEMRRDAVRFVLDSVNSLDAAKMVSSPKI
ncbi:Alpha/Beta hydrolase protein [Xylariaceae sp. FL0594]|nr:Alpha/Beta hydrolase protein [Xylariaceae sp. FL0594]